MDQGRADPMISSQSASESILPTPHCYGMEEHLDAAPCRRALHPSSISAPDSHMDPLSFHISLGLAYTVGSALGSSPPSTDECLAAFTVPNKVGLTAGARAWSKHSHRSQAGGTDERAASEGWWGTPSGPVASLNERALALFWRVVRGATWRNLHWLPHQVLVYETRVPEGYGMRWSQDRSDIGAGSESPSVGGDGDGTAGSSHPPDRPWVFRGFVEPMMDNGHEVGWRQ
ncbi:hypothetical protein PLICRDRAFT_700968 [Plicaturopsis crispa FD-325 SS-3]|nr:hypothetical protein PLICRDRAFT_700968 [Plicaturopsis crispa FD-325 SS-3]